MVVLTLNEWVGAKVSIDDGPCVLDGETEV